MNFARERLVTGLILAGLTASFVAAVSLPGRTARANLRAEIAAAEAAVARGPATLADLKASARETAAVQTFLAETDAALPAAIDPPAVLSRLDRLAKGARLKVVRLEPEPSVERLGYQEHPFRIAFRGDLAGLAEFLRGLERGPQAFAVTELTAKPTVDGAGRGDLEGSLRLTAFADPAVRADFAEKADAAAAALPISMTR